MTESPKTPAQIAEDAKQVGRSASDLASGLAADAKSTVVQAATTAKALAGDAAAVGSDALDASYAYAKDALSAASNAVADLKTASTEYMVQEPGKALLFAFAGGALFATLLLSSGSRGRRY